MCLDYGSWCSEPFRLYDEDEFVRWIRQWPEVDFELARDGIAKLYPAWDLEYAPNLPVYRYDDETGDYSVDEERYEDVFLEELSWRIAVGETCVLKIAGCGFGEVHGHAVAIVGGEAPPQERIVCLSLDDIYRKAVDTLHQDRLLLTHMAAE